MIESRSELREYGIVVATDSVPSDYAGDAGRVVAADVETLIAKSTRGF